MQRGYAARRISFIALIVLAALPVAAQSQPGTVRGTVTLESNGGTLHKVRVLLLPLGWHEETEEDGTFQFTNVPPGKYDVAVSAPALTADRRSVEVKSGESVTADFKMRLAAVREQLVVTAEGREQTTFESFQSSNSLEPIELVSKSSVSIGDVLENQPGTAKRSFGAGNSRPVLRGFDGDRVLIMLDGLSTGSLASQSADHGENLNVLTLERVEIVRGPATLLYGSNAIGGVVNALSGAHQHVHAHEGLGGYISATGGTANDLAGGAAGFDYGWKKWVLRGGAGGQRTGDYATPIAEIPNSRTRNGDGRIGIGRYGDRGFFTVTYDYDNRRIGIPFGTFLESGGVEGGFANPDEEVIHLRMQRHDVKFTGGLRELQGGITGMRVAAGYVRYRHGEYEADALGTDFTNKAFNYRVTFDQRKLGPLTGTFGVSGLQRKYNTLGAEALAPPVDQGNFSAFVLETLNFSRLSFQFGGRFEHTSYDPGIHRMIGALPSRSFNGASGAAGLRVPLWTGGAFVANYTHSYRAPALEELYNNGPHPGNLAFEVGDPNLRREIGNGVDVSLRQQSERVHADVNFFYYRLGDFVFLTPTGNIVDGLPEAEFLQGDSRYTGAELNLSASIYSNGNASVWLQGGLDFVEAELREDLVSPTTLLVTPSGTPLPRIPPLRGRVALDFRWKGLSIRPEGIFARMQDDVFPTETVTAGHKLFNFGASYTVAGPHHVQIFSVNAFNLNNQLYRNHLSFIKDLAPEIGRGVRFGYTVRFM